MFYQVNLTGRGFLNRTGAEIGHKKCKQIIFLLKKYQKCPALFKTSGQPAFRLSEAEGQNETLHPANVSCMHSVSRVLCRHFLLLEEVSESKEGFSLQNGILNTTISISVSRTHTHPHPRTDALTFTHSHTQTLTHAPPE